MWNIVQGGIAPLCSVKLTLYIGLGQEHTFILHDQKYMNVFACILCMYLCMYANICIYIYVCVYASVFIHIHTHIYNHICPAP